MLTSSLVSKVIRLLKTGLEIRLLGTNNEDYRAAASFFSLAIEMFINGTFNSIVTKYYTQYGIQFIQWLLRYYSIIISIVTIILFINSKTLFLLFSLKSHLRHGFSFYMRGLSPLFILLFLNEVFKAVLYGNGKNVIASLSISVSNFVSLIGLIGAYVLPKSIMLIFSQLIYTFVQMGWNLYHCRTLFNNFNKNDNYREYNLEFTQSAKKEFHWDMVYNSIIAFTNWGSTIVQSSILTRKTGNLSLIYYGYKVVNTIIDLMAQPILKFLYNRRVKSSSKELINGSIVYINNLGLILSSITVCFTRPLTQLFSKTIPELYFVVRILALTIMPRLLQKFCSIVLTHQKLNHYNVIMTIGIKLTETFFILACLVYTKWNHIHIVLASNYLGLILSIIGFIVLLYRYISTINYIYMIFSYIITGLYAYFIIIDKQKWIQVVGLAIYSAIITIVSFIYYKQQLNKDI